MSDALKIVVVPESLEEISERFKGFEKQIEKAAVYATRTTTRKVKSAAIAELSKVTGIKARVLKGRVFTSFQYSGGFGRIWIGLNPISFSKMNPKPAARGVRAAGRQIRGGFMPGGEYGKKVFQRAGRERLPIVKQSYRFDREAQTALVTVIQPMISRIFREELERELIRVTSTL